MSINYDIAVHLADHGCAFFTAPFVGFGNGSGKCGYALPGHWQAAKPDDAHRVLRRYRKGDALCILGGHAIDIMDFDPRNGSDAARAMWTQMGWDRLVLGAASTPSGGEHLIIPATGRRKSSPWQGVDHQAGRGDGGVGFAFIAPTQKISKTTGLVAAYEWTQEPDLDEADTNTLEFESLQAVLDERGAGNDQAETVPFHDLPAYDDFPARQRHQARAYTDAVLVGIAAELTEVGSLPPGVTDERGRGWEKATADAFFRGARLALDPRTPLNLKQVEDYLVPKAPIDASWAIQDVRSKWYTQVRAAQRAGALS